MKNDFASRLEHLQKSDYYRELNNRDCIGKYIWEGDIKYINFSSNDYLGISSNEELMTEFKIYAEEYPHYIGACSSRLMTGNHNLYGKLEQNIAVSYGKESSLVFNSGYHANTGIIPALYGKKDLVIADKLVHASIIDGMRLSAAHSVRHRHLDYKHLEQILSTTRQKYSNAVIVSESVFSMDGDIADISKLIELAKIYNCELYIDEAHAVGVVGNRGLGICEKERWMGSIDYIIGTFGKAYAGLGAYVTCSYDVRNLLINHARSLIFTTALPPLHVLWSDFVFSKVKEMTKERERIIHTANYLRKNLQRAHQRTGGMVHIVPLIVGASVNTVNLSEFLKTKGFIVQAVRPPTVPVGTARLRISVNASHSQKDIDELIKAIIDYD